MKNISRLVGMLVLTGILFLGIGESISHAGTQRNGQDSLPDCAVTQISIFNGESFDGTIFLHDADVQLSKAEIEAVKALASIGTPVVCQDASGAVLVTLQDTN